MWPTFFIPNLSGPRDSDCWFNIIKTAGTARSYSDGDSFDPELQFDVIPGKIYRVCGLLKYHRETPSGAAYLKAKPVTEGDPESMVSLYRPNGNPVTDVEDAQVQVFAGPTWPAPYNGTFTLPGGNVGGGPPESGFAQIHCLFKAKAGTNRFGIHWGVTPVTPAATFYWTMLAGSWIDVRMFD